MPCRWWDSKSSGQRHLKQIKCYSGLEALWFSLGFSICLEWWTRFHEAGKDPVLSCQVTTQLCVQGSTPATHSQHSSKCQLLGCDVVNPSLKVRTPGSWLPLFCFGSVYILAPLSFPGCWCALDSVRWRLMTRDVLVNQSRVEFWRSPLLIRLPEAILHVPEVWFPHP